MYIYIQRLNNIYDSLYMPYFNVYIIQGKKHNFVHLHIYIYVRIDIKVYIYINHVVICVYIYAPIIQVSMPYLYIYIHTNSNSVIIQLACFTHIESHYITVHYITYGQRYTQFFEQYQNIKTHISL
jgi:hypothetical protein